MAKICTTCKTDKPLSEYYLRKERGKHNASCKDCVKAKQKARPIQDLEARKQYRKQYYQDNKAAIAVKAKEWNDKNKDKVKQAQKERYQNIKHERRVNSLKQLYGITAADYERMLADQGGACAICGSTDHKSSRTKYFAVDHDHTTGEVRGVLCHSCNKGLGLLQDNPKVLKAAASYLERQKV